MYTRGKAEWDKDYEEFVSEQGRAIIRAIIDGPYDDPVIDVFEDDAKRIKALWNMAHDLNLSTEAIEGGIVQEMVEMLRCMINYTANARGVYDSAVAHGSVGTFRLPITIEQINDARKLLSKIERQG